MKKKFKKWILLFVLAIVSIFIGVSEKVSAEDEKPHCKESDFSLTATIENGNVVVRNSGRKQGRWNVFLKGKNPTDASCVLEGNGECKFPYVAGKDINVGNEENKEAYGEVIGVPDESCVIAYKTEKNGKEINHKITIKSLFSIFEDAVTDFTLTEDSGLNECNELKDWANANNMLAYAQQSLSYCFNPPEVHLERAEVRQLVDDVIEIGNAAKDVLSTMGDDNLEAETPAGYEKVGANTDLKTLTCDAFGGPGEVKKSSTQVIELQNNDICSVKCREDLTIKYDAPIASKAGSCFTYSVEIKSKVKCAAKMKENATPPKRQTACKPKSYCYHTSGLVAQSAGPNEEFDTCVQNCDGGKYSQKCINKCYKKVYSSGVNKMALLYEDAMAKQMSDNCGILNYDFNKAGSNFEAKVKELKKAMLNGTAGHYKVTKKGNIVWQKKKKGNDTTNCYWNNYGAYYFSTLDLAKKTITTDYQDANGRKFGLNSTWKDQTPDMYGGIKGFRRARANTYVQCGAKCKWEARGCSLPNESKSYNQYLLDKEYKKARNEYKRKITECRDAAKAKCKSKTTKFTMSVLPSDKKGEWKNYEATNQPNNTTDGAEVKPGGSFPDMINHNYGTCYGKLKNEQNQTVEDDYETLINFPGVWVDGKKKVYYQPTTGTEHHKNEFCLPPTAYNVNQYWWLWKNNGQEAENKEKATQERKNNIKATIQNFGLFGWNVNIECFYAVYNGDIPEEPEKPDPNCDLGKDKECPPTDITNYSYRAVDLEELYPDHNGEKPDAGWNWSCDATDLSDPNYPIAPTALIKDIQSKGEKVYSDEYLDYSISLTPETIKSIKETNTSRKNFLNFESSYGNKFLQDDMKVMYKSKLLDDLGTEVVTKRPTTAQLKCNNIENGGCLTTNMIEADACINAYNLVKEQLQK